MINRAGQGSPEEGYIKLDKLDIPLFRGRVDFVDGKLVLMTEQEFQAKLTREYAGR